ncbi:CoA ester lyase [Corticibacterium sp. UT-5YL-CI-8]|nr:CoA ester lyase [Tianweitania sp. UT-5YL-CI-8]
MSNTFEFISALFVPGDRPDRYGKADGSAADAIVIDLEDSVAEASKAKARDALRANFSMKPILVRVNAIGTPYHPADVAALRSMPFAGMVLPKAEAGPGLDELCQTKGLPIVALIETARGIADARRVAVMPGIVRIAFGSVDYCADVGCSHSREALLSARSELVLASRLAGLPPPLDGVTTAIDNAQLVEDDARYAAMLGFSGKLAIHPKQIEAILAGFRPSAEEVAWARRRLTGGDGAMAVDGELVDEPVRKRAEAIFRRYATLGQ